MKCQLMLIDGEWVEASDGGLNNVINPATEEVFAQVPPGEYHTTYQKGNLPLTVVWVTCHLTKDGSET